MVLKPFLSSGLPLLSEFPSFFQFLYFLKLVSTASPSQKKDGLVCYSGDLVQMLKLREKCYAKF